MRRWNQWLSRLAATGLLLGPAGNTALALPHWKPRPAGPVTAYAPQMRHFVVVSPTPAVAGPAFVPGDTLQAEPTVGAPSAAAPVPAGRHARLKSRVKHALSPAPAPDQVLWQQQVEPVPDYPWGWFGARRHTENYGHRRYYGGELDWSLRRGD